MYYHISHSIAHTFDRPVLLHPHLIRLRPRSDGWLCNFSLHVDPKPLDIAQIIDLDGNAIVKLWFEKPITELQCTTNAQVETCQLNPFDYQLEPWALKLPIDYPSSLLAQLHPYLQPYAAIFDPSSIELARDIYQKVDGKTTSFLGKLNQHLQKVCKPIIGDRSESWLPGVTWKAQRGSARDIAVLFMEVCRAMGLAARFVSGYQEGSSERENSTLHAWVEVYLPGAGWRGYDPTQGLAVSDSYVALAASAFPQYTAPIEGDYIPSDLIQEKGKLVQCRIDSTLFFQAKQGISD